ncbi:MAG: prepilin-type N-terminal cleavage/methylation domain-containing protein [Proteobacteria bacterium]|nr:prepilin-type N-terminal cleavage/methylation domain-containing protein [Pseudomonadota bacterium]
MQHFSTHRQRGFTMVELMVALLIGLVLVMMLVMITRTMASEATNQQMVVEANQRARTGMHVLKNDLMRAGMFVSPSPRIDPDSLLSHAEGAAPAGYYRNAVVHLNPGATTPDAFVLVGNFIGNQTYQAVIEEADGKVTIEHQFAAGQCEREFNPSYAFAHLINAQGQTQEAKISDVTENCSGGVCECEIDLASGELIEGAFSERIIKIAANQAALYRVDTVGDRGVLMRYLVNYDGSAAGDEGCTDILNDAADLNPATAMVIADYVSDFQIWFRTVEADTSNVIAIAKQHSVDSLTNSASTFRPNASNVIVGNATPASATTVYHLTCPSTTGPSVGFGPEHVRSAVIQLSVRTERTDQQLRLLDEQFEEGNMAFAAAKAPAGDVGAYKVRTLMVEVPMPNLAASMARFQNNIPTVF